MEIQQMWQQNLQAASQKYDRISYEIKNLSYTKDVYYL